MNPSEERLPVLDDAALTWANRLVWAACVAVYIVVFVGSLLAGTSDLTALGKACGFTLATAVLGRIAVSLVGRASLPVDKETEETPMADQNGTLGSLVDVLSEANVSEPADEARAA